MGNAPAYPGAYMGNVFRARFSSLAPTDLAAAMGALAHPDANQSRSVDARQAIDLKLGCAFSRLQTKFFRTHFGKQLGKRLSVTYGPCQMPTLWFCCHRHDQIARFVPRPFWTVVVDLALPPVTPAATAGGGGGDDPLVFPAHSAAGDMWVESDARAVARAATQGFAGAEGAEGAEGGGGDGGDGGPAAALPCATVLSLQQSQSVSPRPLPLNTVALLKDASALLGIGPSDAMHYAEQVRVARPPNTH
jgi:DNA topoisomerase-3